MRQLLGLLGPVRTPCWCIEGVGGIVVPEFGSAVHFSAHFFQACY